MLSRIQGMESLSDYTAPILGELIRLLLLPLYRTIKIVLAAQQSLGTRTIVLLNGLRKPFYIREGTILGVHQESIFLALWQYVPTLDRGPAIEPYWWRSDSMGSTCGTCLDCKGRFTGSRCRGQRVLDLDENQNDDITVLRCHLCLSTEVEKRRGKARALST